jgi:hypothetical protein
MSETSEIKNFHNIKFLKYPISRLEYSFHTGELGEYAIRTIIKDILSNIDIPEHNVKVNGSDIQIFYNGKLIGKFEVLNLDSKSYINSKRAKSIRENLKNVKYKGLICSFFNATSKAKKILKNIPICKIGFQLLPSKFHQYYTRLNKVHHRRIANNRSLKQLKNTLKSFFHRIGLDLLMYVSRISRTRISVSNTLNLKNESLKIRAKKRETEKTENKEARTEEKTESSTFRDKFRTKLGKIGRFLGETMNLLRSLWYDRYGSMSLIRWIPCMKMKTDQKTKKRKRLFQCPFRITLICSYYKQFYACLIQIIDDYITRMERYGYGEEYIDKLVDYTILKYTWKYRNQTVGKCKCKAISFIDDEITSRKPRNGIAVTEPCLKFRCSQLIKDGKCEWLQLCSEYKVKPKQLKLVGFVNGDDTKWSVNHIQDIS